MARASGDVRRTGPVKASRCFHGTRFIGGRCEATLGVALAKPHRKRLNGILGIKRAYVRGPEGPQAGKPGLAGKQPRYVRDSASFAPPDAAHVGPVFPKVAQKLDKRLPAQEGQRGATRYNTGIAPSSPSLAEKQPLAQRSNATRNARSMLRKVSAQTTSRHPLWRITFSDMAPLLGAFH